MKNIMENIKFFLYQLQRVRRILGGNWFKIYSKIVNGSFWSRKPAQTAMEIVVDYEHYGVEFKSMVFSVDAETDGLYGSIIAIGVSVHHPDSIRIDGFKGRVEYRGENSWVQENVIPAIEDYGTLYESEEELLNAFWDFYLKYKNAIVVAHQAYPVESGLFRKCVLLNLKDREWDGPYPNICDIATLLRMRGHAPDKMDAFVGDCERTLHNPYDDAIGAAKAFFMLF